MLRAFLLWQFDKGQVSKRELAATLAMEDEVVSY
jgi:hypothetical protein